MFSNKLNISTLLTFRDIEYFDTSFFIQDHNVENTNEGIHDESKSNERLERVVRDELGKMSAKMDTLMQTLILMEKRLSLVEDQVKLCLPHQSSP